MGVANTPVNRKEAPRMRHSNQEKFRQQVQFLRRQFLQDGQLPAEAVVDEFVLRCCGPQRASDLVLRAEVERSEAENTSTRIHFGVPARRIIGRSLHKG